MGLQYVKSMKRMKGLTNKDISEKSGVPISTVDKILSGRTENPKLDTIQKIASIIGCEVEHFAGEDALSEYSDDMFPSDDSVMLRINRVRNINRLKKMCEQLSDEDVKLLIDMAERML